MSRGTSVSSAKSKPGSRSASSGNSRSSDRQNASIVLIAISPRRSRESIQRARSISDRLGGLAELAHDPLAHLGRGLPRERDREDVGRVDAALEQIDVARDEHRGLAGAGRRLEHDVVAADRRRSLRALASGSGAAGAARTDGNDGTAPERRRPLGLDVRHVEQRRLRRGDARDHSSPT